MIGCQFVAGTVFLLGSFVALGDTPPASWWAADVDEALSRTGANRAELVNALQTVPAEQRKGMAFLIANMPERDLRALHADFLLENVALAYRARKEVPWGQRIPEDIFFNDVLPYVNLDEERHPWRKELYEVCLPLVKDCKSPAEAAQILNRSIFKQLNVRYSTQRKKPNQSPKESMEQGLASCTGLSVLLSDCCRCVCVPARVVGTPLWSNNRGNHTWVEIWDERWHFTGACEPDPKGLDRGWFAGDAARAAADSREHAIYAASFRKGTLTFPLVWNPGREDVYAENVTARYTQNKPAEKSPISQEQLHKLEQAALAYFRADLAQQASWRFDPALDEWLADHEQAVRQTVWKAYQACASAALKEDFDKNQVRYEKYLSPYVVKQVGQRPANGWGLFIAMHGGGGAPKEVNDSQWKVMQRYYRDQESVPGYLYLALRAPNDTWNGFYDDYVPPLVTNLIRQFVLLGDVDPNRVYLMGYSHGGYGAFFVGPKIPDRFAAVHCSAAAPTDGTISPRTLRTTRFTFMVGENDNAYGRRERCEKFDAEVRKLKEQKKGDYPVEMELKPGHGHTGLPDRDKIKEMAAFTRNPVPRHVTWELTDPVIKQLFWLSVPEPAKGKGIDALVQDNTVKLMTHGVKQCELHLDGRLVDVHKPVRILFNGKERTVVLCPRFLALCQSLRERGDPEWAFSCRIAVKIEE